MDGFDLARQMDAKAMSERHNCGGTLEPRKVRINIPLKGQSFLVDGFVCDRCGGEVISRDVAAQVYNASVALEECRERRQIEELIAQTTAAGIDISVWEDRSGETFEATCQLKMVGPIYFSESAGAKP